MKAIIFATLLVCLFALNVEEIIAKQDECTAGVFNLIKPQVDATLEQLKNKKDISLEVELLALLEKGKKMLDKCNENKTPIKVGDIVEWDGYAFLLASNCFKDVGIELLLADTIVQNPTDYVNDVMVGIFGYILGRQAVADCKQFEHFII
eukprot:TRINITY_DN2380_c0_g4_i2.p1 TRINITY_DN2380_c0_g4~~TRINITY_DN2380_c0_g4_i2.p1  ORF type:complete len:150 (+),score=30.36 TRINITY_DN2380_c0_g4_i2:1-450(+)